MPRSSDFVPATATAARIVHGDVLEIDGERWPAKAKRLEVRRASDGWSTAVPLIGAGAFTAELPLSQLHLAPREAGGERRVWQLALLEGGRRVPLALPGSSPALRWWSSGRELALVCTAAGDAAITDLEARPRVGAARWTGDVIELELALTPGLAERELVLMDWHRQRRDVFPMAERNGTFHSLVAADQLLRVPAGVTPRRGEWRFYGRPAGEQSLTAMARVGLDAAVLEQLPLAGAVDGRPSTLQPASDGSLLLSVPERIAAPARAHDARAPGPRGASASASAE